MAAAAQPDRFRRVAAVAVAATCAPGAAGAAWIYWTLGCRLEEIPTGAVYALALIAPILAALPVLSSLSLILVAGSRQITAGRRAQRPLLIATGLVVLSAPGAFVSIWLALGLMLLAAALASVMLVAAASQLLGRWPACSLVFVAWLSIVAAGIPSRWQLAGLRHGVWFLVAVVALSGTTAVQLARAGRGAFTGWRDALGSCEVDRIVRAVSIAPICLFWSLAAFAVAKTGHP